jgi:hypothetical protein
MLLPLSLLTRRRYMGRYMGPVLFSRMHRLMGWPLISPRPQNWAPSWQGIGDHGHQGRLMSPGYVRTDLANLCHGRLPQVVLVTLSLWRTDAIGGTSIPSEPCRQCSLQSRFLKPYMPEAISAE